MSEFLPTPVAPLGGATTPSDPNPIPGQASYQVIVEGKNQMEITKETDSTITVALGSTSTTNIIQMTGGIQYTPTILSDSKTSYTLTKTDHLVLVNSSTYTNLTIPLASSLPGQEYIIIRRFGGFNNLLISTSGSDTFGSSGSNSLSLAESDDRIKLISDGNTDWLPV